MFTTRIAIVFVSLVSAISAAPDDKPNDSELIVGTWKLVEFEASRKEGAPPREIFEKMRFIYTKDGKFTLDRGMAGTGENAKPQKQDGKFTLDTSAKPKTIDMILDSKKMLGIYELTKDELKICMTETKDARPKEFKAQGERVSLITLKRVEQK